MSDNEWYRVRLEFRRIQTWLFSVPKLKTIVGANTLLGEVLRIEAVKLAIEAGACLPDDECLGVVPESRDDDPLAALAWPRFDDPRQSYRQGIIARDGGRFRALFNSREHADRFVMNLVPLIREQLGNIPFSLSIDRWNTERDEGWHEIQERAASLPTNLFHPSIVMTCELSGSGVASETIRLPEGQSVDVNSQVNLQWNSGIRFASGGADDIVSLLEKTENLPLLELPPPSRLDEIAGKGRYLALIHADGNDIGNRSRPFREKSDKAQTLGEWLVFEAEGERFFHGMRVAVRRALTTALRAVFDDLESRGRGARPYQVLMVGGDDVLVACSAEYALPFAVEYARALREEEIAPNELPLGMGMGIAIARPSLPFFRLHEIAESLAGSAKRISRGSSSSASESVVDWMVVSQSLAQEPSVHRNSHDLLRYRHPDNDVDLELLVTAKPYPILAREGSDWSLERLLAAAQALRRASAAKENSAARSQMKAFHDVARRGYFAALFAARDFPGPMRRQLCEVLSQEFADSGARTFPWHQVKSDNEQCQTYRTLLGDLFEIVEIPNLGRRVQSVETGSAMADTFNGSHGVGAPS